MTAGASFSGCGSGYATIGLKNGASLLIGTDASATLVGVSFVWSGTGTGNFSSYGQFNMKGSTILWSGTGFFNNFGTMNILNSQQINVGGTLNGNIVMDTGALLSLYSTVATTPFTLGPVIYGAGLLALGSGIHTILVNLQNLRVTTAATVNSPYPLVIDTLQLSLPSCSSTTAVLNGYVFSFKVS